MFDFLAEGTAPICSGNGDRRNDGALFKTRREFLQAGSLGAIGLSLPQYLAAKQAGKPVWRLVADMSPEEIADIVDYRYLTDALTRDEALAILRKAEAGKAERIATLEAEGYACYTTSAGWLGYDDDKLRRLCQEAIDEGFDHVKMKVGRDLEDDIRRLTIAREVIGPDRYLMIDANQVWEVDQAIEWVNKLAFSKPFFIEEIGRAHV